MRRKCLSVRMFNMRTFLTDLYYVLYLWFSLGSLYVIQHLFDNFLMFWILKKPIKSDHLAVQSSVCRVIRFTTLHLCPPKMNMKVSVVYKIEKTVFGKYVYFNNIFRPRWSNFSSSLGLRIFFLLDSRAKKHLLTVFLKYNNQLSLPLTVLTQKLEISILYS